MVVNRIGKMMVSMLVLAFAFEAAYAEEITLTLSNDSARFENDDIVMEYNNIGGGGRCTMFKLKAEDVDNADRGLNNIDPFPIWGGVRWDGEHGPARRPLSGTSVLKDEPDEKTVFLDFGGGDQQEMTIYPNGTYVKVRYLKSATNYLDAPLTPGGKMMDEAEYCIYGADSWTRGYKESCQNSYYNTSCGDPEDAGALNYKGWMIYGVYNKDNGIGLARLMPADMMWALKLAAVGYQGFEGFARGTYPMDAYLYCFTGGCEGSLELGMQIADWANGDGERPGVETAVTPAADRMEKKGLRINLHGNAFSVAVPDNSKYQLVMRNLSGRVVLRTSLAGAGQHTVDRSQLSSGLYAISLESQNRQFRGKIALAD